MSVQPGISSTVSGVKARPSPYSALREQGFTFGEIAGQCGVSRNAVAGSLFRATHPYTPQGRHKGFRDVERVRAAIDLADRIGLCAAARQLSIDQGQLCRWRQVARQMATA